MKYEDDLHQLKMMCSEKHFYAIYELQDINHELLEALKAVMLCSNFEEAKKIYGTSEKHWTNIVEQAIKKAIL